MHEVVRPPIEQQLLARVQQAQAAGVAEELPPRPERAQLLHATLLRTAILEPNLRAGGSRIGIIVSNLGYFAI